MSGEMLTPGTALEDPEKAFEITPRLGYLPPHPAAYCTSDITCFTALNQV